MKIFIPFLFLMLAGIGFCLFGYSRWQGKMHGSYFAYGFSREANYLAIPIGTSSIILGIGVLPIWSVLLQGIFVYIATLVMLLGFLIAWRLFKPKWVKWVQENHKEIIPYLAVEIRDHGWHVETQEELEGWIRELYRRYRHNFE